MEPIFKATPYGIQHVPTTFLFLIAAGGYFVGLHEAVFVIAGVWGLGRAFRDEVSLHLFEERFIIRYGNYFGKLMATDVDFFYDEVKQFDYEIDRWEAGAGKTVVLTFLAMIIPGWQSTPLTKTPKAQLSIVYTDGFGNPFTKEISFRFRGRNYDEALQRVKKSVTANKQAGRNKTIDSNNS